MRQSSQMNDKKEILEMIRDYSEKYHQRKPFTVGDKIHYAGRVYGSEEIVALADSALDFWLTSGKHTACFEHTFAKMFHTEFCSLVNSGSSANLLAFMALTSPLLGEKAVRRGDEVITVAAGFPTTVSPIVQYGAVPVFVDVTIPEYNIDVNMLEQALSEKTKAVMLAHTLGNPFDIKAVKQFCDEHELWLIEDNCDALGSQYVIDGQMCYTGTIGDIGTSSFYPPHHITMGEGGAVYTSNPLLNKIVRSMRDWGRDCCCPSGTDNLCGHRFDSQYARLPKGYDHKYVYSHFGYNLKATDMQAAIGVEQLKRFEEFTKRRKENFTILSEGLSDEQDKIILPKATENAEPSWFGFMMMCRDGISRDALVEHLEANRIQTRMLFAGNIVRQPCFDTMYQKGEGFRIAGDLKNTDKIMRQGFWIGLYPGMTYEMLEYMIAQIKQFLKTVDLDM